MWPVFFFQAEDGIRDFHVTGVQTCALPILAQSAQKMGFKVAILDPDEDCPAQYVAHEFINAAYSDDLALKRLGEISKVRSEEHTSELQSRENLVCRLLLEKKKDLDTGQSVV